MKLQDVDVLAVMVTLREKSGFTVSSGNNVSLWLENLLMFTDGHCHKITILAVLIKNFPNTAISSGEQQALRRTQITDHVLKCIINVL